jgi:hypothetical protein
MLQIKSPQITSFQLPPSGLKTVSFLFTLLSYGSFSPASELPLFIPAQFLHSYISAKTFKIMFGVAMGVHVLEAMYTTYLCRKHGAGLRLTVGFQPHFIAQF